METELAAKNVVALYQRHAAAWVQARLRDQSFVERGWFVRFTALLPSAGNILDCGCGAGEPIATHLVAAGYDVVGVDSSEAMLDLFRSRLPRQRVFAVDMRQLFLGERFDGIVAWDSFFHLSRDDQRQMFATFRLHLKPGGALLFTSGPSDGEVIGQLEGEPLYHASLDSADYVSLLEKQGLRVVANAVEDPSCDRRTVWLARAR